MGKTGAPQIRSRINELGRGIVVGGGNDDDGGDGGDGGGGGGQDKEQRKLREWKEGNERKRGRNGKRMHGPSGPAARPGKTGAVPVLPTVRAFTAVATRNIAKRSGRRKSGESTLSRYPAYKIETARRNRS